MPILLRSIRSKKRKALITDLNNIARKQIEKDLRNKVAPALVKSHNLVVADWKHKPEFQTRIAVRPDKISVTVFPAGENAGIYALVDEGTEPHEIKPVRAPLLVFQTGYISKTLARPARTVSGGGISTGPTVRAKIVHHPGFEGREFSKTIAEDIEPRFKQIIDNSFKMVSKQLEE